MVLQLNAFFGVYIYSINKRNILLFKIITNNVI